MKKLVISLMVVCILGGSLAILRIDIPFSVIRIQKQFKAGQTTAEVAEIIKSARIQPDICWWVISGREKPILSESGNYDFPPGLVALKDAGENFKMHLGYVGPGFLKNDFKIVFDHTGRVVSVTDIRRWD